MLSFSGQDLNLSSSSKASEQQDPSRLHQESLIATTGIWLILLWSCGLKIITISKLWNGMTVICINLLSHVWCFHWRGLGFWKVLQLVSGWNTSLFSPDTQSAWSRALAFVPVSQYSSQLGLAKKKIQQLSLCFYGGDCRGRSSTKCSSLTSGCAQSQRGGKLHCLYQAELSINYNS